jgi:hypothetical protein
MALQASGKCLSSSPPGSSGTVAGRPAGALDWDSSAGVGADPTITQGVLMQQWLNLVPVVGALLNLSAAVTNLAITIMNRRSTTTGRADNDIAR